MRVFLAALFVGIFLGPPLWSLDFWDKRPAEGLALDLSQAMSIPELASQVMLIGFPRPEPDEATLRWIRTTGLGGVKYFGWNSGTPRQVALASGILQAASQTMRFRIPLVVATDQEGGWVRHIKGTTTTTAGNLSLGAAGLPSDAYRTAQLLGSELRQMGVNMNFAPSVDLYVNPDNTVIGPRSFSQNPVEAGVLGMAFFKGLASVGVIATAKHFPGHGNTSADSHGRLPVIMDTLDTLQHRELVPYRMMIDEGLSAIMTGHLSFPKVSGDALPASLSPHVINEVLRGDLHFRGVILTDDLVMEGARPEGWSMVQTAQSAIEAGNDLLMVSRPLEIQQEVWNALVSRAQADAPFLALLREAARRVLLLKLENLKGPQAVPLQTHPDQLTIPEANGGPFVLSATARGATLLASRHIPWKESGPPPLVISPYSAAWAAVSSRFPGAQRLDYPWDFFGSDARVKAEIIKRTQSAGRVLFVLSTPGSVRYLKALEPWKDKLAVVSVLSPVYLRETPWVQDSVAVYGTNSDAFEVAVAALAGDFTPKGRLPMQFGDFPHQGG